ncbi:hypothetical protein PAXRUDRAFT_671776 [Paxillus rubicundulus Ve08.2h10]|uniref:Uncharacterized protein n=1 Tax=Paxillus rubicundulus Ve08.2h10 TaxID=930991 RepID=A0A0D0EC09_9AGAM|nr:hypothetical protein PAXRUDRAFT_671776 [Paxillus rubicundulus Ve08.2h10]
MFDVQWGPRKTPCALEECKHIFSAQHRLWLLNMIVVIHPWATIDQPASAPPAEVYTFQRDWQHPVSLDLDFGDEILSFVLWPPSSQPKILSFPLTAVENTVDGPVTQTTIGLRAYYSPVICNGTVSGGQPITFPIACRSASAGWRSVSSSRFRAFPIAMYRSRQTLWISQK